MSYSVMCYLKEWLKAHFGVVRFDQEFISWDHVRLEVTLLNGEFNHTRIRQCEEYIQKHHLPVVLNKKMWKQNGVYGLLFSTGQRANDSIKAGTEVLHIVTDLKELIIASEKNYASTRSSIREHVDRLHDYIQHEDNCLPFEVLVRAEKVINEAERLMEKNEILFETGRIANELKELTQSRPFFIIEKFSSDVEFNSLIKLTRAVGKVPSMILIYSPDGYIQARCSIPEV